MILHENRTSRVSVSPMAGATFGCDLTVSAADANRACDAVIAAGAGVLNAFHDAGGLMVMRGLAGFSSNPEALVRLSTLFGPEVEDIRQTLTGTRYFHPDIPEIMVLSNKPGVDVAPPPRPPGPLPIQFPDRINWHTDQSYRRPPPDVSLLFAVSVPPSDQGQTVFADGTAAYAALRSETRSRIADLEGLHAMSWVGRGCADVRAGVNPHPLLPHQRPVRQPLVRVHPVTGRPALYLCEEKQMDFIDGPIVGMQPGPDGDGARLLRDLLHHMTDERFVAVHAWQEGDLVIGDNRCLLHAASWYDSARYARELWRTTVMGTPGPAYANEPKSWMPPRGVSVMHGMESA